MSLDPEKVVASFDSASVLHAATVAALEHRTFPHLGNPPPAAWAARVGGRLPWPILKRIYARIGGAEGLDPAALGDVDLERVAAAFAGAYTERSYPAALVGSSNGALTHLAAAMGTPWLPGTVLVPVHHVGPADRPDLALEFGRQVAPTLLAANPDVRLHQMHDSAQDELMVARMAYFRTKWTTLPAPYARFLGEHLAPGAPILLVHDESTWPVTGAGDRHVFQVGGRGGLTPEQHLRLPHAPAADQEAPEAEWGSEPGFSASVETWGAAHGHPVIRVVVDGPQEAAHPAASVLRAWTQERGGAADRLIVPSFVLGDPWRTIELGRVPFWTYFPVEEAADSLDRHLAAADPYRVVDLLVFQHGADSPGIASPRRLAEIVRRHGATPNFVALRVDRSPRDIGSLGRYGPVLAAEPTIGPTFSRLAVADVLVALHEITGDRARSIVPGLP